MESQMAQLTIAVETIIQRLSMERPASMLWQAVMLESPVDIAMLGAGVS
jgi:hypothetical protein